MKMTHKIFAFLFVLLLGLVSCTSCTKKDQSPGPSCSASVCPLPSHSVPPPKGKLFQEEDWEITIPDGWVNQPAEIDVKIYAVNDSAHSIIIFSKEVYTASYEAYTVEAIRSVKQLGAALVSVQQVELNGTNFVLIESQKDQIKVWMWLTTRNGSGYTLTCGGLLLDKTNHNMCMTTANSLKLK